jgi:glycosyltransferase involved in cell wall biosynthesis
LKVLIVATAATPSDIRRKVALGEFQRLDYLELADLLHTDYIDYNAIGPHKSLDWVEDKLRMDFRLAHKVVQLVQQEGYDLVLSLSERVGLPLTLLLDRRVKHVVMMHHPMSAQKLRLMKVLDVRNCWDHIIAISQAEAKGMQDALDLPDGFITPILTPIDTLFFQPLDSDFSLEEQDHILSLGLSHRDYPTLIRAMRRLPEIICHLRIGSAWVNHNGGHEDEILPANIQIKSFVAPDALRIHCARSRFLVIPIQNDTQWSAGCTSVQIGQAMAKAVIASDRPGLADYLIDGETGLLVRTGDEQDMAEAIDYLWRNPRKAMQMGQQGREWLNAHYSIEKWLVNIIEILHRKIVTA